MASWFSRLFAESQRRSDRRSYRPMLESLEDRTTPTTFLVSNFTDGVGVTGTLRAAITAANNHPGPDAIEFGSPFFGLLTLRTISLFTPLHITDTVTIDGSLGSRFLPPGSSPPGIELVGAPFTSSDPDNSNGIEVDADGCHLSGLIVRNCRTRGIVLNTDNNVVTNCYIGTNAAGNASGGFQQIGILVRGNNNVIGGTGAGTRNIISGNGSGIVINGGLAGAHNNVVQGNRIGTDLNGVVATPNLTGVFVTAAADSNNQVLGNLISGNTGRGIFISGASSTTIQANKIGTALDGVSPLGNGIDGIRLDQGAHDNLIGGPGAANGNIIAFSGQRGILIGNSPGFGTPAGVGNQLQNNILFGGFPIDLGPADFQTPNDVLDADTGPNNLQNVPILQTAIRNGTGTQTTITGALSSKANHNYRIEVLVFSLTALQDEKVLGSFNVTTDAAGNANFNQILGASAASLRAVAFATDLTTNDSSELGNDVSVDTAPMIKNDVLTPDIDEGGVATLSGQLVDPDVGDKLTLRINWGDGSAIKDYRPGLDPFAFDHRYTDDGVYDVNFTWLDNHGGSNTRTRQVNVHNVAPTISHLEVHPDDAHVNQRVVLTGRFVDPGADTFTLTINWGDATVETVERDRDGEFHFKHRYQQAGHFTLHLTLTDDDGGSIDRTLAVDVAGA